MTAVLRDAVWAALGTVRDPELDEPITDLEFVSSCTVSPDGVATVLGVVGYTAKGLAIAGAGILVIIATFTSDPAKATGLDGALKTLGTAPFGQVLLWAAGLGIVVYGAYCFVLARYGRM